MPLRHVLNSVSLDAFRNVVPLTSFLVHKRIDFALFKSKLSLDIIVYYLKSFIFCLNLLLPHVLIVSTVLFGYLSFFIPAILCLNWSFVFFPCFLYGVSTSLLTKSKQLR